MSVCEDDEELQSWGWTDLSSYALALLDSEKEQHIESFLETAKMSRRSLRLDNSLLDRSLPQNTASFSLGGAGWRNTRSLKSRRSQQLSVSCSESLLHTPHKQTIHSLHNSSLHSVASDASLLSSMLDESTIQETTLVDTLWGLDQDIDPKESTVIADQSTMVADSTLVGRGDCCHKHPPHALSRVYCKDCEEQVERKESTFSPSTICTSTSSTSEEPDGSEASIIYTRDRKHRGRIDVLQLFLDSSLLYLRRAAACCVSVLTHSWQLCQRLVLKHSEDSQATNTHRGRLSHCRVMSLSENTNQESHPNGSLCDDCKEKQSLESETIPSSSSSSSSWFSAASCLLGFMWSAAVFTGKSAADACTRFSKRCQQMNTSSPLNRFPGGPLMFLSLLLLFCLCLFGPACLHSLLPAVNVTEESSIDSSVSLENRAAGSTEEERREEQTIEEPTFSHPADSERGKEEVEVVVEESMRLVRLEQSLTALWEKVEAGGRRAEQRHKEVLRLYSDLQQMAGPPQSEGDEGRWVKDLMETKLEAIQTQVKEERLSREQTREQDLLQQQSESTRLDELEKKLHTLAERTQDVQGRQEAASAASPTLPATVSVGVDRQSHDALLAEVAQLEAALEDLRRDVEGLSVCKDGCRQMDTIQQTLSAQVSSQVREEVRTFLYGNQLALRDGASADPPDSLLQWLSQQYVSGADLQEALASLELSILKNISQQLEEHHSGNTLKETITSATRDAGAAITEKDVDVIVANALRLYSYDRTGLADFALESGGGSIISTRCSQTYETKAALLSLFGVPLWYFSQSPRVVIQPDVHPGNCWAFKGSTGFLVIRLSMSILPTAFSLEHIPKALAPSGTLRSAPKDFSVYGLADESQETGKLLGTYTFDEDGESLQTYSVTEENMQTFQIIEVQVLSNWGHEDYTCLYRFRVHGTPADV